MRFEYQYINRMHVIPRLDRGIVPNTIALLQKIPLQFASQIQGMTGVFKGFSRFMRGCEPPQQAGMTALKKFSNELSKFGFFQLKQCIIHPSLRGNAVTAAIQNLPYCHYSGLLCRVPPLAMTIEKTHINQNLQTNCGIIFHE
jgi:hypothetical protein